VAEVTLGVAGEGAPAGRPRFKVLRWSFPKRVRPAERARLQVVVQNQGDAPGIPTLSLANDPSSPASVAVYDHTFGDVQLTPALAPGDSLDVIPPLPDVLWPGDSLKYELDLVFSVEGPYSFRLTVYDGGYYDSFSFSCTVAREVVPLSLITLGASAGFGLLATLLVAVARR
jgi:hypothetical protein